MNFVRNGIAAAALAFGIGMLICDHCKQREEKLAALKAQAGFAAYGLDEPAVVPTTPMGGMSRCQQQLTSALLIVGILGVLSARSTTSLPQKPQSWMFDGK